MPSFPSLFPSLFLSSPPPSCLVVTRRRLHDGHIGVVIQSPDTKGRLEGCELWGNKYPGVLVSSGADPVLAACTIRDGLTCGVAFSAGGKGLLEDCELWGNVDAGGKASPGERWAGGPFFS